MNSRKPKKVAIVRTKGWGKLQLKDYDGFISTIENGVEILNRGKEKKAETMTFEDTEEARQWLNNEGIIMFISRGDQATAKKFAADNPKIQTILATGLPPEREVIFLDKIWIDLNLLKNLISY